MRKTSYVITFLAVAFTLVLNVLTHTRADWLQVYLPEVLQTKITLGYGLSEVCTYSVFHSPDRRGGKNNNSEYTCRPFPTNLEDKCNQGRHVLCASWTTAGYFVELAIGFGALSLLAILVGVSTGSRRRRIWRAVAGLVLLHGLFQLFAFAIVTEIYNNARFPTFEEAELGTGYILNTVAWITSIIIGGAVITTGISADKGHHWAAGNRAYHRIQEEDAN